METLKLTFVGRYDKKKDGTPLVSAKGKPYTSVRIKTEEYGDQYLSGFGGVGNANWKVGDTVEVEVEKKGEYLNFSLPKGSNGPGMSNELFERLMTNQNATNANVLRAIGFIQELARELRNAKVIGDTTSDGNKVPDFEPGDVPFEERGSNGY